jgi:hypothetical protein
MVAFWPWIVEVVAIGELLELACGGLRKQEGESGCNWHRDSKAQEILNIIIRPGENVLRYQQPKNKIYSVDVCQFCMWGYGP